MATDKEIREHLGHGRGTCWVVIHKDGMVEYRGSTDPLDRKNDFWHYGGTREELDRMVERERV